MWSRIKAAVSGLIESINAFRGDVEETRRAWRQQFRLDAKDEPEPRPALNGRRPPASK